jgi:hypothetical protein
MEATIQNVRSIGRCPTNASATPVATMSSTPGIVNQRSLWMIPSSACARALSVPARSACIFQNTPVMMLPRNKTTLTMCSDFSAR